MLKRINIENPTQQQKEETEKRVLRNITPFYLYLEPTNRNMGN